MIVTVIGEVVACPGFVVYRVKIPIVLSEFGETVKNERGVPVLILKVRGPQRTELPIVIPAVSFAAAV